jgi:hypothetical protein
MISGHMVDGEKILTHLDDCHSKGQCLIRALASYLIASRAVKLGKHVSVTGQVRETTQASICKLRYSLNSFFSHM